MHDLSAYHERAIAIYKVAFATPGIQQSVDDITILAADMKAAGVKPDRISLLLRSAMNDVQMGLTNV